MAVATIFRHASPLPGHTLTDSSTTARSVRSRRRSEGSPLSGADQSRHNLVFGGSKTRTMMQSYASAAKLRGGGPILPFGMTAMSHLGTPPPRTVVGDPLQADGSGRNCWVPSATSVHCAGRRTTPSGTTPSRTSRHRAISNLRAKATIMVLRVPRALSVRARTTAPRRSPSGT